MYYFRKESLQTLRLRGNFKHNAQVLENNEGILLVVYRPQRESCEDYK